MNNSLTKLKNPRTNWKYILIVVILAFVVGGGILKYMKNFNKEIVSLLEFREVIKEPKKSEIKPQEKVMRKENAKWKIYKNGEYGFEIEYPSENWELGKNLLDSSLSLAPLFDIDLVTGREILAWGCEGEPRSTEWHSIFVGIEVYEKPFTIPVKEWLTKFSKHPLQFTEYRREDGVYFYKVNGCLKCPIYLTKNESKYVYGLRIVIGWSEKDVPLTAKVRVSIPDSVYLEIFDSIVSNFKFWK